MKKFFVLVSVIALLITANVSNAIMSGNDSCNAFAGGNVQVSHLNKTLSDDPCDLYPPSNNVAIVSDQTYTINSLVIDGAAYFLKASADANLFLNYIELSDKTGADFNKLKETLNAAIKSMEKASASYLLLRDLANATAYNQAVINRLLEFDYEGFMKKNALIPVLFDKVQGYLAAGDVRGVYNEFYLDSVMLLKLMYELKSKVDRNIFPNRNNLWVLNQKFMESRLFGQYVAQVFYNVK